MAPRTDIDLNADIGEGCGEDEALLPWVSSASIACGGHAGDAGSMRAALRACQRHGVAAGAHPAFEDRAHFGRRALPWEGPVLAASLRAQLLALQALAREEGVQLRHVKPHGALYNLAARDGALAALIVEAVRGVDPGWAVLGLAGGALTAAARAAGLLAWEEGFADRGYAADGSLLPRGTPGALRHALADALEQVLQALRAGAVRGPAGERVPLQADSFCLHGDSPGAAERARALHAGLRAAGIAVRAPGRLGPGPSTH